MSDFIKPEYGIVYRRNNWQRWTFEPHDNQANAEARAAEAYHANIEQAYVCYGTWKGMGAPKHLVLIQPIEDDRWVADSFTNLQAAKYESVELGGSLNSEMGFIMAVYA
jgi:hypothetical protein